MNKVKQIYLAIKAGLKLATQVIKTINKLAGDAQNVVDEIDVIVDEIKEVLQKHI